MEIFVETPDSDKDPVQVDLLMREFMGDVRDKVIELFQEHVPRESGRTYDAISAGDINKTAFGYSVQVGIESIQELKAGESEYYPLFVHEGTGLFSDRPHWIQPLHGNVMTFENKKTGDYIITRNTQGQEAQPYLDTVEERADHYLTLKKRELAAIINRTL